LIEAYSVVGIFSSSARSQL